MLATTRLPRHRSLRRYDKLARACDVWRRADLDNLVAARVELRGVVKRAVIDEEGLLILALRTPLKVCLYNLTGIRNLSPLLSYCLQLYQICSNAQVFYAFLTPVIRHKAYGNIWLLEPDDPYSWSRNRYYRYRRPRSTTTWYQLGGMPHRDYCHLSCL